ncbi:MAG TPA: MBL fold metallo-hydrolase [Methanocella sp.]|nr:MBL fold metallo-hydrolase [Methanocella sp.]
MKIKWLGHSCFLLKSDEGTRVVTDPFNAMVGYRLPDVEADVVTTSHDHGDHNNVKAVKGPYTHLSAPGHYSVGDIDIRGIPSYHDDSGGSKRGKNVIFCFEIDGISVCHLGDLGHPLTPQQVAAIGPVDVLLVPVGGRFTIDGRGAAAVAGQLKPRISVPMHYRTRLLQFYLDGPEKFLEAVGGGRKAGRQEIEVRRGDIDKMAGAILLEFE